MAGSGRRGGTAARTIVRRRPGTGGPARRWPWAVAAVVAGGLAGGAVALVLRRRGGAAPEDVQEPDEVEAVVDRPVAPSG
jgi:hypothetical protein